MDKYYIPDLEELVKGLNLEYFAPPEESGDEDSKFAWRKTVFSGYSKDIWELQFDYKYAENFKVRVKYLDKEDIELLGFEESIDDTKGNIWFEKGDIQLCLSEFVEYNIEIINDIPGIREEVLFKGYIKNRNELIKLLKQLNIN